MKICLRAGLPVVPFSIDGSYRVNPRHRFRIVPGTVRLTFGRPVPAGQVASMSATELHDHVRAAIERQLGATNGPAAPPQN
jgi:1-acyl-sn-glycerol-3-phosphate acyltransferase